MIYMQTENYFLNCHSEESIKIRYKKLAKKLHPDKNIDDATAKEKFQEMKNQRDAALWIIYRKSGISDEEIEKKLQSFVNEILSGDTSGINDAADILGKQFQGQHPDKELNTENVFKFVFDNLLSAAGMKKVFDKGDDKKKLDK